MEDGDQKNDGYRRPQEEVEFSEGRLTPQKRARSSSRWHESSNSLGREEGPSRKLQRRDGNGCWENGSWEDEEMKRNGEVSIDRRSIERSWISESRGNREPENRSKNRSENRSENGLENRLESRSENRSENRRGKQQNSSNYELISSTGYQREQIFSPTEMKEVLRIGTGPFGVVGTIDKMQNDRLFDLSTRCIPMSTFLTGLPISIHKLILQQSQRTLWDRLQSHNKPSSLAPDLPLAPGEEMKNNSKSKLDGAAIIEEAGRQERHIQKTSTICSVLQLSCSRIVKLYGESMQLNAQRAEKKSKEAVKEMGESTFVVYKVYQTLCSSFKLIGDINN